MHERVGSNGSKAHHALALRSKTYHSKLIMINNRGRFQVPNISYSSLKLHTKPLPQERIPNKSCKQPIMMIPALQSPRGYCVV